MGSAKKALAGSNSRKTSGPGSLSPIPTSRSERPYFAGTIRQKIAWDGPPLADEPFLEAFYAALRGRLERRLLLGKRRESKHDRVA